MFIAFLTLPKIANFTEHSRNTEQKRNKFGTKKVLFLVAPFTFFFYLHINNCKKIPLLTIVNRGVVKIISLYSIKIGFCRFRQR